MACKICNATDMYTEVTMKKVCAICTVKLVGGIDTDKRIEEVRVALGLKDGEFLKQNNAEEARKILGK